MKRALPGGAWLSNRVQNSKMFRSAALLLERWCSKKSRLNRGEHQRKLDSLLVPDEFSIGDHMSMMATCN